MRSPVSHHDVEIVHRESLIPLSDGSVGEIWISGPSSLRYWQRSKETEETFVHHAGDRWLRTGDLGFVHAGQLYIAGRCKDLIIVRGQNIYPQDIEKVVEEEVEASRKGRVAAFPVETASRGKVIGIGVEISRGMRKLVSVETWSNALSEVVSDQLSRAAICGRLL